MKSNVRVSAIPVWHVTRRQLLVLSIVLPLILLLVGTLYFYDRFSEWELRQEQATHRLELAYELISRDLQRVRSEVLGVANEHAVREFDPHVPERQAQTEYAFRNFLTFKDSYQQIRLIDHDGRETLRAQRNSGQIVFVPENQLQDKKDRYYFRQSLALKKNEVFVSEFDLNQEHGEIETPLNPVIRFVTPVGMGSPSEEPSQRDPGGTDRSDYLLVANYQGAPLLRELASIPQPGRTYLIRSDGQFLLGPNQSDCWGWLLNHKIDFASKFPAAWHERPAEGDLFLTPRGAFAFRSIRFPSMKTGQDTLFSSGPDELYLVSHLPRELVLMNSSRLLYRILITVSIMLIPLLVITRMWSASSVRRQMQNQALQRSEQRLRELSGRLVQVQDDERRAISREIHDQLGQQVTAINLDLKLAAREASSEKIRSQLVRAIDESEELLSTLHDFATRIRPVELEDLGLDESIKSHLLDFDARFGIQCEYESNLNQRRLSPAIAENIYRLVQESVNNVLKHAQATTIQVTVNLVEQSASTAVVHVSIRDNGSGIDSEGIRFEADAGASKKRLGILGMKERIELLDGAMHIDSHPDRGTTVSFEIPVKE